MAEKEQDHRIDRESRAQRGVEPLRIRGEIRMIADAQPVADLPFAILRHAPHIQWRFAMAVPPITLDEFARGSDRDATPIFAGRETELAWLAARVDRLHNDWRRTGSASGPITAVTGCPGIGKTALKEELAKSLGETYWVIEIQLDDLKSRDAVVAAAARSAGTWLRSIGGAAAKDAASIVSAGHFVEWLSDFLASRSVNRKGAVVLFDEAQTLDESHTGGATFLHKGSNKLPLYPIFFGLSDTPAALQRAGASRAADAEGTNLLLLGLLDAEESKAVADRFCGQFNVGVQDPATRRSLRILREDSRGFPQHLHSGLRVLARTLGEARNGGQALDAAAIRAAAANERERYYARRYADVAAFEELPTQIARFAHESPCEIGPLTRQAERLWLKKFPNDTLDRATRADVAALVRRMLHNGLLSEQPNQTYRVPIPSLMAWMDERFPERRVSSGQ